MAECLRLEREQGSPGARQPAVLTRLPPRHFSVLRQPASSSSSSLASFTFTSDMRTASVKEEKLV